MDAPSLGTGLDETRIRADAAADPRATRPVGRGDVIPTPKRDVLPGALMASLMASDGL